MPDCSHWKHERELREQWERLHLAKHEFDDEAIRTAREAIDRRLDEMNELRSQINSERGNYVQRDFYDEKHNSLKDTLDTRLKVLETAWSNMQGRIWMMGAAISAVVVAINLILRWSGVK